MIAQEAPVSQERLWSQIFAKVWVDDEFKQRLMDDPRSVLAEHGIDLPEGAAIRVVEDTAETRHLVLPPPPADELTDEDLVGNSATYCFSGDCGRCGCGCGRCRYCD